MKSLRVVTFALWLAFALLLAFWRLANPPVSPRLNAYTESGNRFLDQGHHLKALEMFRRALTLDATNQEAGYGYLKASLSVATSDTSIDTRKERLVGLLAAHPDDPHLVSSLAALALMDNDIREAIVLYERAVYFNERLPHVRYGLGVAQLRNQNWRQAEANLRAAVTLAPSTRNYRHDLATALIENGKYHEALDLLGTDLKQRPFDTYARLQYAKTLRLMREFERSVSILKYLHWTLQHTAVDIRPWRFLMGKDFVYIAPLVDRIAYVELQLALSAYMSDRQIAGETFQPPASSVLVIKLVCNDVLKLAKMMSGFTDILSSFAERMLPIVGESCRISAMRSP
ncbi:MAG: hypothetical protein OES26_24585 [Gammaproteobacteria bacterium]|nr:hypothetical protein [Gammaproteobacteria bacterium]